MNPNLALTADNKRFIAAMEQAGGAVGKLSAEVNVKLANSFKQADYFTTRFEKGIGRLADKMQSAGRTMSIAITAPLTLAAGAAARAYAEYDSLQRGIVAVDGQATNLKGTLGELKKIAEQPGLGFQEAIQGYVRLRAVGIEAELAKKALKEFGNAIATTGGGKAQLDSVTYQLGQMSAKGKVLAQDLRPIIEASPAVAEALKKMFGTVDSEGIQKALQGAGKSSTDFIKDLVAQLEKMPRVAGGFKNALENLSDGAFIAGAKIGELIDKNFGLTRAVDAFTRAMTGAVSWLEKVDPAAQRLILGLAGVAAAAGPVLVTLGGLVQLTPTLVKGWALLTNPLTLLAASLIAVTAGFVSLYNTYNPNITSARKLADVSQEAGRAAAVQSAEVKRLAAAALDESKSQKERLAAYNQLHQMAPDRFRALQGERIETEKLKTAVQQYTAELLKNATAKAAQSRLEKMAGEQFDLNDQIKAARSAIEEAKKMQVGSSGVDAAMGNPTGTMGQGAVNIAARRLANLKGQLQQNIEAQKQLAEIIRRNEVVLPSPKPPATGGTSGGSTSDALGGANPAIAAAFAADKKAYKDREKAFGEHVQRLSFIGQKSPFNITPDVSKLVNPNNLRIPNFNALFGTDKIQFDGLKKLLDSDVFGKVKDKFKLNAQQMVGIAQTTMGLMTDAFAAGFEGIGQVILGRKNPFSGLIGLIADAAVMIGRSLLALGTPMILSIATMAEGIKNIAAGGALITAGTVIRGLAAKKFANGGVMSGPTFGLMGEYPGAFANKEIVGRFDQFAGLLQPLFTKAVAAGQGFAAPGAARMELSLVGDGLRFDGREFILGIKELNYRNNLRK